MFIVDHTGSGGWTASSEPSFLYRFSVTAGPLTVDIPYDTNAMDDVIADETIKDRTIDLSGGQIMSLMQCVPYLNVLLACYLKLITK